MTQVNVLRLHAGQCLQRPFLFFLAGSQSSFSPCRASGLDSPPLPTTVQPLLVDFVPTFAFSCIPPQKRCPPLLESCFQLFGNRHVRFFFILGPWSSIRTPFRLPFSPSTSRGCLPAALFFPGRQQQARGSLIRVLATRFSSPCRRARVCFSGGN